MYVCNPHLSRRAGAVRERRAGERLKGREGSLRSSLVTGLSCAIFAGTMELGDGKTMYGWIGIGT